MEFDVEQNRRHDAAAAARFPGPDYYEVLGWLHADLKPAVYLEIGVMYGESLRLALPPTVAIGIDPAPLTSDPRVVRATSAEFFARGACPQFALAFIDGLHLFEQVAEDLAHLEPYAGPEAVVAIHDTVPLDEETAGRVRTTEFHTGDVWKIVPYLKRWRPELEITTVRTAPTGLTLVRGLGAGGQGPVKEFAELGWEHYTEPDMIPSDRAAVRQWLRLRQ